jgi:hypothetical protein
MTEKQKITNQRFESKGWSEKKGKIDLINGVPEKENLSKTKQNKKV